VVGAPRGAIIIVLNFFLFELMLAPVFVRKYFTVLYTSRSPKMNGGLTIKTIPIRTIAMLRRSNIMIGSFKKSLADITVKIGAVAKT